MGPSRIEAHTITLQSLPSAPESRYILYAACMGAMVELFMRTARRACIVVGPLFTTVALGFGIYTALFVRSSEAGTGTVISLTHTHGGEQGEIDFAPVFIVSAKDGHQYTVTAGVASKPPEFHVGQSVPVLYKSDNPSEAKISTFIQLWFLPLAFGIMGIVMSLCGYGLLRYEHWRDRKGLSIAVS